MRKSEQVYSRHASSEKRTLFVPLLAAKRAQKPAKRPQKPANERKSQKVGQLGLFHALPAQKHALIGHRCRVMLATGNASTEKGNYIDIGQILLAQISSQTASSTLDAGLRTSFPAVRTRTPSFPPIVPITQNAQKFLGV